MGLGRRKRSDYLSEELNKRHSAFLEDTGKENGSAYLIKMCFTYIGMLLGFGKRSEEVAEELNKRHSAFLEDTGKEDSFAY